MSDDALHRWHAAAHKRPSGLDSVPRWELFKIGADMAHELGVLRERNALLEQATRQEVVAFIERLAAQDCAFLQTRRTECGDGDYRCIPCDARVVYERMRAGI